MSPQGPRTEQERSEYASEAAARSMDRMLMTMQSEMDGRIAFDFRLEDTEAVLVEMESGAPCGVCGQARCRERDADA